MLDYDMRSINLENFPSLIGIVKQVFVKRNKFYLQLERPNASIIATIKEDYTAFRKGIGRLLKERRVGLEETKFILEMIDESNEIIYPDNFDNISSNVKVTNENKKYESDIPDTSDTHSEVKTVNVSECIKLDSGRVQVKGNVFGLSEPYKVITSITPTCYCKNENTEIETTTFDPPIFAFPSRNGDRCSKCNSKIQIVYKNAITVQLQDDEKFNDIERITCVLLDVDMDNIRIGERVMVTGDVHVHSKNNRGSLITTVFADNIEYINREQIVIGEKDIEAIKRFARKKGPLLIQSMVEMFHPSIFGNNIVKESLLYALVSTGNDLKYIKDNKGRNRINVLLAGQPGLAKSSLLRKAVSLVPDSRYESVQHSSSKSLTAIVSKENEQHFLRLGPIPLSKGSVCALNEIGTMGAEDQNHLLDIMEEGTFTNNKYGFNSKIDSPTTIIASANLRDTDSLNSGYTRGIEIQNKLYKIPLESQLLDRFDLIIIVQDNGDEKALIEFAEKKIQSQLVTLPKYDVFIKKFILYARNLEAKMTDEASNMIRKYYINLNKKSNTPVESKRSMDTLIRLCKAVARLHLRETIDPEDVAKAISFYNEVVYNYLGLTAPVPKDPVKTTIELCIKILKENKDFSLTIGQLITKACEDDKSLMSYLFGTSKRIEQQKLQVDKNRKIRTISQELRSNPNITIANKNPLKFQYNEEFRVSSLSDVSDVSDSEQIKAKDRTLPMPTL